MTEHNHPNAAYDGGPPSATAELPTGRALVAPGAAPPMVMNGSPYAAPAAQDVIRGGMDAGTLFHAFRRRWLLAVCMGLLAGAAGGALLWQLFPESSTAFGYFEVKANQEAIFAEEIASTNSSYDIFRKTQMVMLTSPNVLERALRDGQISANPFFAGVEEQDRVQYLREELEVTFPEGSEILEIRLSGAAHAEELKQIVEAVAQAFYDEVIYKEIIARRQPRDILQSSYETISDQIQRNMQAYLDILEQSNKRSRFTQEDDPEAAALHTEMRELVKRIGTLKEMLDQSEMSYIAYRRQAEDPAMIDQQIDQMLEADPKVQYLKSYQLQYEMYAMELQSQSKRGSSAKARQMMKRANEYAQQLAQYREEFKQQYKRQRLSEPDPNVRMLTLQYLTQKKQLNEKIALAEERMDEIIGDLDERGAIDADLLSRESEIEGLEEVRDSIAQRIEHWDIELNAPERVKRIPGVETSENINKTQRYAIAGVGGMGCFALVAFGIAYLEFSNRKLNGPDQVEEGLGIRVIGTLPSLSGRRALNPSHPVVAQLTESIDSVRTALMHDSTTKRRQIVLVTSPAAMEGRTTVASQLAASLARAGRRTLLIDGDLRRPAMHSLFDLPLEDGLCEVLRAEVDVTDVIRPTHAEGLWVLTAGYCDADAVHALATDQVQPIFEKLRSEYDFIIIDGPPVLGLSDSLLFGQHCDGAVLSVLRDQTSLPKIHQSAELLRNVGIRLIGSVVNGMPAKADNRVTHLQSVGAKSDRRRIEQATEA